MPSDGTLDFFGHFGRQPLMKPMVGSAREPGWTGAQAGDDDIWDKDHGFRSAGFRIFDDPPMGCAARHFSKIDATMKLVARPALRPSAKV